MQYSHLEYAAPFAMVTKDEIKEWRAERSTVCIGYVRQSNVIFVQSGFHLVEKGGNMILGYELEMRFRLHCLDSVQDKRINFLVLEFSTYVLRTRLQYKMSKSLTGMSLTQFSRRRLISIGERKLGRWIEDKALLDVRWTSPEVTDQPLFIEDAAAFGERCAMNNEVRLVTGQ
jgi:hypothetical protein